MVRKAITGGAMAIAFVAALSVAAWACTSTGHYGTAWFCQSSSSCASPGGSIQTGTAAWERISARASTNYDFTYGSTDSTCHTQATFGQTPTNSSGKATLAITAPAAGTYTTCPTIVNGTEATNHKVFTVTS